MTTTSVFFLCSLLGLAMPAATMETVAGTGGSEENGTDGTALEINIAQPFGVEIGPEGALYITEVGHHRVWRLDQPQGPLALVAGTGARGYSGDGGPASEARLNEPYEVRFDHQGHMFFVEMKNHIVRRVDARTGSISTVAGTGKQGYGGDGGPATRAMLNNPHSIALDDRGGLYVADIGNHRIRRIDLASGAIETVAGTGERQLPRDGQAAKDHPMLGPRALFIQEGSMWIALREGHSVWRLDLHSGTVHHVAGTGKQGYSGDGGPASKATFNGPKGIAVDSQGNVYVADTENHVIRKIDPAGTISTVAGSGQAGGRGDGGLAVEAELNRPHGICVGPDGAIYIGDTLNHRVRRAR